jgi:hypothetical protein
MGSMVLQVDSRDRCSFDQYGPWTRRERNDDDAEQAELGMGLRSGATLPVLKDCLRPSSKNSNDLHFHGPKHVTQDANPGPRSTKPMEDKQASLPTDPKTGKQTQQLPSEQQQVIPVEDGASQPPAAHQRLTPVSPVRYEFQNKNITIPLRQSIKRRRPDTDVDGHNTASLGCKKRRLLRHLITSRLSQPFSLPATHILNREAVATGDRRFTKLAAIMVARRVSGALFSLHNHGQKPPPHHASNYHPSPSTMLMRAAVINRFRLRVRHDAVRRGDEQLAHVAADATLLHQSQSFGIVRFPVPMVSPGMPLPPAESPGVGRPLQTMAGRPPLPPVAPHTTHLPHPLSRAAAEMRLPPPPDPPSSPGLRLPPSPRIRPVPQRSPQLRPLLSIADLDDDEDDVAFPTSDLESRYDMSDDPDDMYADFDVIFGGGGTTEEEAEDDADETTADQEHYEEYMDDLDGIPWGVR